MSDFALMHVLKARGRVLVQDYGREGWQHLGISQSGAADEFAFNAANQLLFNPAGSASLEICLGNCEFVFNSPAVIAITGAKAPIFINDQAMRPWSRFAVAAGDVLRIGFASVGLLIYVAIAGGFQVKKACASASQCEREQLGPNGGKPYQTGDMLAYRPSNQWLFAGEQKVLASAPSAWWPATHIPQYNRSPAVLQATLFAEYSELHELLLNNSYAITERANRMAYRLSGPQIKLPPDAYHCQSAGVPFGAIQLPPDGQPIILLKDRQTMGGYPIIGCIDEQSAWRLSQLRPGQTVGFCDKVKNLG